MSIINTTSLTERSMLIPCIFSYYNQSLSIHFKKCDKFSLLTFIQIQISDQIYFHIISKFNMIITLDLMLIFKEIRIKPVVINIILFFFIFFFTFLHLIKPAYT
jgi:hypothetical protein